MKKLLLSTLLTSTLGFSSALAQGPYRYVSANVFLGQGTTQQGHKGLIYNAAFMSTTTEADGYYHLFINAVNQAQGAYAEVNADQRRAACNDAGNDSCITPGGTWHLYLVTATQAY